ncbi:MT-A70 family methyltransferase [Methylobacterium sp. Leaf466]|uniref:MT-A70 family methyltransferase n=1 Tax=Methylobacterium sp. Leaf466 TaxID=1736386 RepID=UPI000A4EB4C2|nr:MT-A70 family methyltransferase [Methylobacterium sp. Leaf466]
MKPGPVFRPSQIHAMGLALLENERAEARARMSTGAKGRKISGPSDARDRIARHFGISGRQLEKIGDVCRAAEAEPDRFGPLLAEMDRTGKVNGPHTKLLRARDEERILGLQPVAGRFRTLVVDPPWGEDNISDAAGHDYALMSLDEIRAMPVGEWADDDCHLYLWATNNTLQVAFGLLEPWGFAHKTVLTWTKADIGFGRYFRNRTEHVIFAVRGTLRTRAPARATPTDHDWPVGQNSEKPKGFYDLVRACSFPPYGEAFQRLARPDFVNLYQPAPAPLLVAAE